MTSLAWRLAQLARNGRSTALLFHRLRIKPTIPANQRRTSSQCKTDRLSFPLTTRLRDNSEVTVRHMTDSEMTTLYKTIVRESASSQSYGINQEDLQEVLRGKPSSTHTFTVSDPKTDEVMGYFIVTHSPLSRGARIGEAIAYVKPSYRLKGISHLVLDLAENLLKSMGYIGIYVDFFTHHESGIRCVKNREGYKLVATIPISAELPDGTLVGAHIFFKDFRGVQADRSTPGAEQPGPSMEDKQ